MSTKRQRDPLVLVQQHYDELSKVEKKVADYVQLHPDRMILASLQAMSEKCGVSDASVLRFCRSLGFSGYQDFKAALVPELLKGGVNIYEEMDFSDDHLTTLEKFFENINSDIRRTITGYTEDQLRMIAKTIIDAERIVILGLAGSAGVARIFNDSLLGLGICSQYLSDRVEIERVVDQMDKNDLAIGISHSGETPEVVYGLKKSMENGSTTIGLTNFASSSLVKYSDIELITVVPENILGSYSCQPRIAQLALLEFVTVQMSKIMKEE